MNIGLIDLILLFIALLFFSKVMAIITINALEYIDKKNKKEQIKKVFNDFINM